MELPGTLTLERIYPKQLDLDKPDDCDILRIHLERYDFASTWLSGERVLDMACGCGYGTARLAEQHRSKGGGNAVLQYYRQHPAYLLLRLRALLRYGLSNRYLTCCFIRQPA